MWGSHHPPPPQPLAPFPKRALGSEEETDADICKRTRLMGQGSPAARCRRGLSQVSRVGGSGTSHPQETLSLM